MPSQATGELETGMSAASFELCQAFRALLIEHELEAACTPSIIMPSPFQSTIPTTVSSVFPLLNSTGIKHDSILCLPTEIHVEIIKILSPAESVFLGITSKAFYVIYWELHGPVLDLCSRMRREGYRVDLCLFWYLAPRMDASGYKWDSCSGKFIRKTALDGDYLFKMGPLFRREDRKGQQGSLPTGEYLVDQGL